MVSLLEIDVGTKDGQGRLALGPHGGVRLLHGAEHLHDLPEAPVALVDDGRTGGGHERGADEERAVVCDVLDDPKALDWASLGPR
jgi:hypothetical protein